MSRKRPLDVAFPVLPHDNSRMSWRDGECPGDWTLTCGDKEFRVHRIIVMHGPRASQFLRASANQAYGAHCSDISTLIPEACWELVEIVLDYFYGEDVPPLSQAPHTVFLLKLADVLQIKPLFEDMLARLNDILETDLAELPSLLTLACAMLPGAVADGILEQVAHRFWLLSASACTASTLRMLSTEVLTSLLSHPRLKIRSEDDIFKFLANGDLADFHRLPWQAVRFEHLSAECADEAQSLLERIPCTLAMKALLSRLKEKAPCRSVALASKLIAAQNVKDKLVEQEAAEGRHSKKVIAIELFSYILCEGHVLLSIAEFRETFTNKMQELSDTEPNWNVMPLFATILEGIAA